MLNVKKLQVRTVITLIHALTESCTQQTFTGGGKGYWISTMLNYMI